MHKLGDIDNNFLATLTKGHIKPTLGGDPEFFVADKNNKILASDKFFPSKHNPLLIKSCSSSEPAAKPNEVFFDGIQAEIAIGCNRCREYLATNVARCMKVIREKIGPENHIIMQPAVRVQKSVINSADPEAKIFGCLPDFNAYTLTTNTAEMDATRHPYRYAGGHIHIGISSPYIKKTQNEYKIAKTEEGHIEIIKFLDLFVGIPSVLLDSGKGSKERRAKYGKAGCFRPTPYGVEYRTLSCWWLKSPITLSLVYGLARIAWSIMASDDGKAETIKKQIKYNEEQIRNTIDSGDKKEAQRIWRMIRPYMLVYGTVNGNPLHIHAMISNRNNSVAELDHIQYPSSLRVRAKRIKKAGKRGEMPETEDPIKADEKVVFGIAAFEYMLKNGLGHMISDDAFEEWSSVIDNTGSLNACNGFATYMFKRLHNDKDFEQFQRSLFKTL